MTVRVDQLLARRRALRRRDARERGPQRTPRTDRTAGRGLTRCPGRRLLEGGPLAEEIRRAVAEDVASFTARRGRAPGLARRHRRARRPVRRLPRADPAGLRQGRHRRRLRRARRRGDRGQRRRRRPRAERGPGRRRRHRPDAAAAGDPPAARSSTRSIRPRTSTASTRSTPASSGWATTASCPPPRMRPSRSSAGPGSRSRAATRSSSAGPPWSGCRPRSCSSRRTPRSRSATRGRGTCAAHVARADIVVVAAGQPGLVTGAMLKPGAVVVDVGINVVDGHIVGDVDFATAVEVASAITPVPGGVGPLTNAILLTHLIRAAERQAPTEPRWPRSRRPVPSGGDR